MGTEELNLQVIPPFTLSYPDRALQAGDITGLRSSQPINYIWGICGFHATPNLTRPENHVNEHVDVVDSPVEGGVEVVRKNM